MQKQASQQEIGPFSYDRALEHQQFEKASNWPLMKLNNFHKLLSDKWLILYHQSYLSTNCSDFEKSYHFSLNQDL